VLAPDRAEIEIQDFKASDEEDDKVVAEEMVAMSVKKKSGKPG
jgi:hypothetical protein